MLSPPPQQHHSHHFSIHVSLQPPSRLNYNSITALQFTTGATTAGSSHHLTISSCSRNHRHHHRNLQSPEASATAHGEDETLFRRHNAKSTALLLRQLSKPQDTFPEFQPLEGDPYPQKNGTIPEEDRVKVLEMSMVRKRTPQFPGSIYVQSPSDVDVNTSLPPIQTLFDGEPDGGDDEMLLKALEIRRNVTIEIFKEAMRRGKFGITYSTNLVSKLPEFIDYIMIKAASMKQLPEFAQSTFNVRARTVIDESNVVTVIRWLKYNSLSYPQIAKVICMSKGNLHSIRCTAEWLKSIHVRGRFIGVALTKSGENILERSTEELDEVVDYLESNGVRREWMGYVISRCPQLLSYSHEEVKSRVQFYLDMGMNEKDFGTMVFDFPKVLGFFSAEEMRQKVLSFYFLLASKVSFCKFVWYVRCDW